MIAGHATPAGTARYAARFPRRQSTSFYRLAQRLTVSSLGLGTYLGDADPVTDRGYTEAVAAALRGGINFLDTAINYRNQRSEWCIGAALNDIARDEVVLCTKAGFLTPGAVSAVPADLVAGAHSMHPDFLADQIDRSRANLNAETIDVFYLHNPETQLDHVPRPEFEDRLTRAFSALEELVAAGKLCFYGTATWSGYRESGKLDFDRILALARAAGGERHHFGFIQLPFNLAMREAHANGLLEKAASAGITVVASASLLQSRLASGLPEQLRRRFPGHKSDAQRALQFARSAPGITVALAGMAQAVHVHENLGVAAVPPLTVQEFLGVYGN